MTFGSVISRITDIIVTLLPDPDSPTIPTTSPSPTVNETPSTARTIPSSVRNETWRSLTSSRGSAGISGPTLCRAHTRVEPGIQQVDERARESDEEGAVDHRRHDHRQVERGQRVVGQQADAREAEHDLRQERAARDEDPEVEAEEAHERDHRRPKVVLDQDAPFRDSLRARGADVVLVLGLDQIRAQDAGVEADVEDGQRQPREDEPLEPLEGVLRQRRVAERWHP